MAMARLYLFSSSWIFYVFHRINYGYVLVYEKIAMFYLLLIVLEFTVR